MNNEVATKIFNDILDDDDLNKMHRSKIIAQPIGFKLSAVAIIEAAIDEHCRDLAEENVKLREMLVQLRVDSDKVITNLCNTGNDEAWSIIKLNNMITDIDDTLMPTCATCEGEKTIEDTHGNIWPCYECVSPKLLKDQNNDK